MLIELAAVGTRPKNIDEVFAPGKIDLAGEPIEQVSDILLQGVLRRRALGVELAGNLRGEFRLTCPRCLKSVEHKVDQGFRAVFVGPDEDFEGSEVELDDESLDQSVVESGNVDLNEVVREQLLLAVPERAFCSEDCRGLCPKCGADLNLIDCSCGDDEVDPRWAALSKLK
jgi:uncharacterized protein